MKVTMPMLALCLTPLFALADAQPISESILVVSDQVQLAGRLAPDAAARLRGSDTVVIDLRTPEEGVTDESHALWRAGITYINLPMTGAPPSRTDVALFDEILAANAGRDVIVHCASGNRAGLLWAAHLIDSGAAAGQALAAVRTIVTKAPIERSIEEYAAQNRAMPPASE